jgi:hypothetical protein
MSDQDGIRLAAKAVHAIVEEIDREVAAHRARIPTDPDAGPCCTDAEIRREVAERIEVSIRRLIR